MPDNPSGSDLYAAPDRSLLVASSIPVVLVAAALVVTHFSVEIADYLTQHAVPRNSRLAENESGLTKQDLRKGNAITDQPALADRAVAPADVSQAVPAQQIVSIPEAGASLKETRSDGPDVQADQARSAPSLEAEAPARETAAGREQPAASMAQGRQTVDREPARSAFDEAIQQKLAAELSVAELRQSLQQEQQKTTALMQEAKAAQAMTVAADAQRLALEEAQARAVALAKELSENHREVESWAAQSQKALDEAMQQKLAAENTVAAMRASLQQEQEKTAALMKDAKAAQAMIAAAEQQQLALEAAQARTAALASELAGIRSESGTRATQAQKALDEAVQQKQAAESTVEDLRISLQREQQKTTVLMQEANAAQAITAAAEQQRLALEAAEARATQSQKALDEVLQQKQAAEGTILELRDVVQRNQEKTAASMQEAEAAQAMAVAVEQQRRALEESQARSVALVNELEGNHRESETRAAQSQKAIDEALQQKQAAEVTAAELRLSLRQERDRIETIMRDHVSERRATDGRSDGNPTERQAVPNTQAVKPATAESPTAAPEQGDTESAKLLARAGALIGQGNIGAARIVLERASESGNVRASFMLAETYDPAVLSAWGTYGTRGETTKAREHYEKAQTGGIREAKDRLDALSR